MIIQKLKPEQRYMAEMVQAVAFEGDFDLEKARENAPSAKEDPNSDFWGAFSDDEKTLYGCLVNSAYNCLFDGSQVKLGGIGGVATLPQYRRGGVIRKCFCSALNDMYERGFTLSFLYPFSTQYYRQFGYEAGAGVDFWTFNLSDISNDKSDFKGEIRQLFSGDDMSDLLEIYNGFYRECNLKVMREKYDEALEKENILNQKRYVYVWYDENGKAGGFFIGKKILEEGVAVMDCTYMFPLRNGFFFLDACALRQMFSFVKSAFSADYKKIRFFVPAFYPIQSFVGENNSAQCKRFFNGMLRVVNVEQALLLCKCKGKGKLNIGITDSMVSKNEGVWKLEFENGKANVVKKCEEKADITMKINDFSALILGARSFEEVMWMPNVKIYDKNAPFESVFHSKKCFMPNLF